MKTDLKQTVSAGGIVRRVVNGKVFIVLTREEKRPDWVLPKGHVEKGETIEETAIREVKEETGLSDLKIIAKLGIKQRASFEGDEYKTIHYFLFETKDTKELKPVKDNGKTVIPKWFPINNLPTLFWPTQKQLIEENLSVLRGYTR